MKAKPIDVGKRLTESVKVHNSDGEMHVHFLHYNLYLNLRNTNNCNESKRKNRQTFKR